MKQLSLWLSVVFGCLACEPHVSAPSQPAGIPTQPSDTPAQSNQPPVPNPATTVTVRVTSAGRPVSGALVTGYHETARTLEPLSHEHAYTGADGRLEFSGVLPGTVYFMADKEPYLRPCMATSAVDRNTSLELELVTPAALQPLRPTVSMLIGVVYDHKMRPAPAATVGGSWLEEMHEFFTMTDEKGRYFLCGLPDDFLMKGVVKATASRLEVWHSFNIHGKPANQGNGQFVLDLYLKLRDLH